MNKRYIERGIQKNRNKQEMAHRESEKQTIIKKQIKRENVISSLNISISGHAFFTYVPKYNKIVYDVNTNF